MKKILISLSLVGLLFLGACSASSTSSKDSSKAESKTESKAKEEASTLDEPIVVNGLEITVKQLKTTKKAAEEGKKSQDLYSFEISGKNVSPSNLGLGSVDFVLTTDDGKEVKIDDSLVSFGDEVEPDKTISGKAYYAIEQGKKVKELRYKSADKTLASWKVATK